MLSELVFDDSGTPVVCVLTIPVGGIVDPTDPDDETSVGALAAFPPASGYGHILCDLTIVISQVGGLQAGTWIQIESYILNGSENPALAWLSIGGDFLLKAGAAQQRIELGRVEMPAGTSADLFQRLTATLSTVALVNPVVVTATPTPIYGSRVFVQ